VRDALIIHDAIDYLEEVRRYLNSFKYASIIFTASTVSVFLQVKNQFAQQPDVYTKFPPQGNLAKVISFASLVLEQLETTLANRVILLRLTGPSAASECARNQARPEQLPSWISQFHGL
jgi:hypothetical protein